MLTNSSKVHKWIEWVDNVNKKCSKKHQQSKGPFQLLQLADEIHS